MMPTFMWIIIGTLCAVILLGLLYVSVWLDDGRKQQKQSMIYDGMELAGARCWERCDGGWFKTTGTIHVHTMIVDGTTYIDAMRIEEEIK
jgi:hypothetical protein